MSQTAEKRAEAAEARVAELESFQGHWRASRDHADSKAEAAEAREKGLREDMEITVRGKSNWQATAEASRAREAELAGALEQAATRFELIACDNPAANPEVGAADIRTVLAATPTEARERAKAKDEVITAVRAFFPVVEGTMIGVKKLFKALAKLNALDRPAETEGDGV